MNKPVRPTRPAPKKKPEGEENAPKKVSPAVIIIPIVVLLIGGLTTFFYFNQDNESLASVNPFVIFKKEEVKVPEPEPLKEPVVEEPAPEPEISSHTSRYFIVVGSFNNRENALKMKDKLERKNVTATIVEPSSDGFYYRVAVDDFETKDDAIAKLKDYKKLYGKSVWVLSY